MHGLHQVCPLSPPLILERNRSRPTNHECPSIHSSVYWHTSGYSIPTILIVHVHSPFNVRFTQNKFLVVQKKFKDWDFPKDPILLTATSPLWLNCQKISLDVVGYGLTRKYLNLCEINRGREVRLHRLKVDKTSIILRIYYFICKYKPLC